MKPPDGPTERRVLFVNHTARVSGAELSLLGLIRHLDRNRFLPLVACPEGPLAERVRGLGVRHVPLRIRRVVRTRSLVDVVRDLVDTGSASLSVACSIAKHRIDLVHANATTAHVAAGPAAMVTRVPVIWHVRDLVELGRLGKLLFAMADAVACISESVERHVARYGGDRDKVWTVTNGIDLATLRERARPGTVRSELDIPDDAPVVTQVGQITPWKGHRFLLRALPRLRREFPALRVLVVGEPMTPKDADYLTRLRWNVAATALDETVLFTGWRDDVPSVIADSDVVVLPSRAEPFGRAVLEAMALGKPVVATNTGGLPELVSHRQSGLLVDYGDAAALADAIAVLLRSPEVRRHMGENAAGDAERFDLARTAAQIQNLYDDLLDR